MMKNTSAMLRLAGIEGLCAKSAYKGWIDLASFALCPSGAVETSQTNQLSFRTAGHECIPQLNTHYVQRSVVKEGELVVCEIRDDLPPLQVKLANLSLLSVRTVGTTTTEGFSLFAEVEARCEKVDLTIAIPGMADGWHSPAGLLLRRFEWPPAGH